VRHHRKCTVVIVQGIIEIDLKESLNCEALSVFTGFVLEAINCTENDQCGGYLYKTAVCGRCLGRD